MKEDNRSNQFGYKTTVFTVLVFIIVLAICEVILRSTWIQSIRPVPFMVGGYRTVEEQFHLLDEYQKEMGAVDCVIIGSSLTAVAVNPMEFDDAFSQYSNQSMHCYNFSISAGTVSSFEVLTRVIAARYHPELIILTTSIRDFSELSNEVEEAFPKTPWAQYHLGNFNLRGWAEEHLYTVRYLSVLPEVISSASEFTDVDEELRANQFITDDAKTIHGYTPLINFLDGAPIYWIRDNLIYPKKTIYSPFHATKDDQMAFNGILQQAKEGKFRLIIVEMPSPDYFFFDKRNAPKPDARDFLYEIASDARESNIPFWLTNDQIIIPAKDYADSKHMYIRGSFTFSHWLGAQIGEAVRSGFFRGTLPDASVRNLPLSAVGIEVKSLARHGMSEKTYSDYLKRLDDFSLIPSDAKLLNPQNSALSRDDIRTFLGFYIEWKAELDQANRDDYFDLYIIQNIMVFPEDLQLTKEQSAHLMQWYETHRVDDLKHLDVDFILYTQRWGEKPAENESMLDEMSGYKLIKYWEYSPLRETYYLYQVR